MKKSIVFIFIFIITSFAYSQKNCDCNTTVDLLIKKIEQGYPGFIEKTSDTLFYNNHKYNITETAKNSDKKNCIFLMKDYLAFFKDKHISIKRVVNNDNFIIEPKTIEIPNINEITKSTDEIEGIWKTSKSTIGIIKSDKQSYTGFILKKNDSIKNKKKFRVIFELSIDKNIATLYGNKTIKDTYKIYDNSILTFQLIPNIFIKKKPLPNLTNFEIEKKIKELKGFHFKQLSAKTLYLKLPSFDYNKVDLINNLIDTNKDLLEKSENLIIDIRDNPGGTDNAYKKILPYISTNTIRTIGYEFLATQNLVDEMQKYLNNHPNINETEKDEMLQNIELYKNNIGKFVNTEKIEVYKDSLKPIDKSPKHIVIIINNSVGSSAENFVYKARQSKKVKIVGVPTVGVMDYGSVRQYEFECKDYELFLPTFRSLRLPNYPIDNIGLQPDIYIDKSIKDWVKFTKEYIEN